MIFHRHVWKINSREERESALGALLREAPEAELTRIPTSFFARKLIVTFICTKCHSHKVEVKNL